MSEDLIRRSDAIKAINVYDDTAYALQDVQRITDGIAKVINAIPTIEPKAKVVAQVTFDEEKLREIVKGAVERFKEEYEIVDRPQGEWIEWVDCEGEVFWKCSACGQASEASAAGILYKFCPFCGADMRGKDDEASD